MLYSILICKGNNSLERKFCFVGNMRYMFKNLEKIILVKVNNFNVNRIFKLICFFIFENVFIKNCI